VLDKPAASCEIATKRRLTVRLTDKMRQELVNQTANNRARASHYAGFPCIRLHAQCAYDVNITGYGELSASEGDERNALRPTLSLCVRQQEIN